MPTLKEIVKGRDIGYRSCGENRYIWLACLNCGKERWIMLSRAKQADFNLRCNSCAAKERAAKYDMTGNKNPQWRGGRHKLSNGYIVVWVNPDDFYHHMAKKIRNHTNNYVLEHRLVMAQHLHRCLESWELVHHINGIRDDNRLKNLHLVNQQNHEHRTLEKELQKEISLLKWQVKLLTQRLNQAGIPIPEEDYKSALK